MTKVDISLWVFPYKSKKGLKWDSYDYRETITFILCPEFRDEEKIKIKIRHMEKIYDHYIRKYAENDHSFESGIIEDILNPDTSSDYFLSRLSQYGERVCKYFIEKYPIKYN